MVLQRSKLDHFEQLSTPEVWHLQKSLTLLMEICNFAPLKQE